MRTSGRSRPQRRPCRRSRTRAGVRHGGRALSGLSGNSPKPRTTFLSEREICLLENFLRYLEREFYLLKVPQRQQRRRRQRTTGFGWHQPPCWRGRACCYREPRRRHRWRGTRQIRGSRGWHSPYNGMMMLQLPELNKDKYLSNTFEGHRMFPHLNFFKYCQDCHRVHRSYQTWEKKSLNN